MKLIFLDIDGCCNNHEWDPVSLSSTLRRENVEQLNRIIHETGAKIVLVSAWRYIVNARDMTLKGFGYLLRTHGVTEKAHVIGLTSPDETCSHCFHAIKFGEECESCGKKTTRQDQVYHWRVSNYYESLPYVVIDDLDLGFTEAGTPFVQPDKNVGLTAADADRAIAILNG